MLRYIKHNMSEIAGIEIYPIISLLIFVLFFTVVIWRTMRISKSEVNKFSNIPLEEEDDYLDNKSE
ncbi:MAG: CcoQ/FixQ family Cbb3-type cytochrome c oxidase assembly chaperone [Brumimicrobium sp.]